MNLYLKYLRYHWRTLLTGLLLSIIFGLGSLAVIWLLVTITFLYEHYRSVKEMGAEKRHQEILRAFNRLRRHEDNNSITKKPTIWGEA